MYYFDFGKCKFRTMTIGGIDIHIPYYEIIHGDGPTVLITAGMDGDEYNGIQACIELAHQFQNNSQWSGTRIIYPLVNMFGYHSGVSWNPLDSIYPKHIYPGNMNGSSTEQIIYTLFHSMKHPDIWIDLHGGNRNERLTPFVWTFPAHNDEQTKKLFTLLSRIGAQTIVYSYWKKADIVQRYNTLYLLFEAGEKGILDPHNVSLLSTWVCDALDGKEKHGALAVYSSLKYYLAKQAGYLRIDDSFHTGDVKKGSTIGMLTPMEGKKNHYSTTSSGHVLWYHDGGWIQTHDIIAVIAEEREQIGG
jgi:hypothetical protein